MRRLAGVALVVALVLASGVAWAADKKADPTGTWTWKAGRAGMERDVTLKLKLDGKKLTGTVTGPGGKDRPIEDASYKDGAVAFKVTGERDGRKFTIKYKGKVSDDTIKGKVQFGERMRDWVAKRSK